MAFLEASFTVDRRARDSRLLIKRSFEITPGPWKTLSEEHTTHPETGQAMTNVERDFVADGSGTERLTLTGEVIVEGSAERRAGEAAVPGVADVGRGCGCRSRGLILHWARALTNFSRTRCTRLSRNWGEAPKEHGPMAELTLVQAINLALAQEMDKDSRVVILGEDVGLNGSVFRVTEGLQERFGEDRVVDTPLAESGIIATAIGLAINGMRPVPEIQFEGFLGPAYDQIVNHAGRYRTPPRGSGDDPDDDPYSCRRRDPRAGAALGFARGDLCAPSWDQSSDAVVAV